MTDQNPITPYELRTEALYSVLLWTRHERLYRRVSATLALVQLVGGSAAISASFGQFQPTFALWGGVAMTLATILDVVLQPGPRAVGFAERRATYTRLRAQLETLTDTARMGKLLWETREADPPCLEALRGVAYADTHSTTGHPRPRLSLRQWLASMVA